MKKKLTLEKLVKNTEDVRDEIEITLASPTVSKMSEESFINSTDMQRQTKAAYRAVEPETGKQYWFVIEEMWWCGRECSEYAVAKFESKKEAIKHCDKLNELTEAANKLNEGYYVSKLELQVKVRGGYVTEAATNYFLKGINYEGE